MLNVQVFVTYSPRCHLHMLVRRVEETLPRHCRSEATCPSLPANKISLEIKNYSKFKVRAVVKICKQKE
jgi:hypothetical protein